MHYFFYLCAQFDPDPINSCSIYYDSGQNICRKNANKKSHRWVVMSVCVCIHVCLWVYVCVCVCMHAYVLVSVCVEVGVVV